MVDETTAALSLLDEGDARRTELQQWLADGLRTLFADARATAAIGSGSARSST